MASKNGAVREAIVALEVDELVEVRQGSGVYVIAHGPRGDRRGALDIGPFELLEARRYRGRGLRSRPRGSRARRSTNCAR